MFRWLFFLIYAHFLHAAGGKSLSHSLSLVLLLSFWWSPFSSGRTQKHKRERFAFALVHTWLRCLSLRCVGCVMMNCWLVVWCYRSDISTNRSERSSLLADRGGDLRTAGSHVAHNWTWLKVNCIIRPVDLRHSFSVSNNLTKILLLVHMQII